VVLRSRILPPLRKNLKTNSLYGFPRARNLRAIPIKLLISRLHPLILLLLNRIPPVKAITTTILMEVMYRTLRLTNPMRAVLLVEEAEIVNMHVEEAATLPKPRKVLRRGETTQNREDLLRKIKRVIKRMVQLKINRLIQIISAHTLLNKVEEVVLEEVMAEVETIAGSREVEAKYSSSNLGISSKTI
jgi:hypothetical protein